jgi:predicted Rossmann fold nucleotide-binding protein DprA/Smf involved in DNA uptake
MRNNLVDPPTVAVEYDGAKGKRVVKPFPNASQAKTFYAKMLKDGKKPKVLKDSPPANGNAKPAAEAKPKKAAVERDAFGQSASTQGAKLNAVVLAAKKPLAASDLAEKTGLSASRIAAWVRTKTAKGFIKRHKDGTFEAVRPK